MSIKSSKQDESENELYIEEIEFPEILKFSNQPNFNNIVLKTNPKKDSSNHKTDNFPQYQKAEFLLFLLTMYFEPTTIKDLYDYIEKIGINTNLSDKKTYFDLDKEKVTLSKLINNRNNIIKNEVPILVNEYKFDNFIKDKIIEEKNSIDESLKTDIQRAKKRIKDKTKLAKEIKDLKYLAKIDKEKSYNSYILRKNIYKKKEIIETYSINLNFLFKSLLYTLETPKQDFKEKFKPNLKFNLRGNLCFDKHNGYFNEILNFNLDYDKSKRPIETNSENFMDEYSNNPKLRKYFTTQLKKEKLIELKYFHNKTIIEEKLENYHKYYIKELNNYNSLFQQFYDNMISNKDFFNNLLGLFSIYVEMVFQNNILRLFTLKDDYFIFHNTFKGFIITISQSNIVYSKNKKLKLNVFEEIINKYLIQEHIDKKSFKKFVKLCQIYTEFENSNTYKLPPNATYTRII